MKVAIYPKSHIVSKSYFIVHMQNREAESSRHYSFALLYHDSGMAER
jgi:hypothetical protein